MRVAWLTMSFTLLASALSAQVLPPVPPNAGYIETWFQHENTGAHAFTPGDWVALGSRFHALHIALIPRDVAFNTGAGQESLRGRVVVWNYPVITDPNGASPGWTFWSIVDPEPAAGAASSHRFMNFKLVNSTTGEGDLACSGQTWLENGTLFVAGGTEKGGSQTASSSARS